jgi:hypothetical protein
MAARPCPAALGLEEAGRIKRPLPGATRPPTPDCVGVGLGLLERHLAGRRFMVTRTWGARPDNHQIGKAQDESEFRSWPAACGGGPGAARTDSVRLPSGFFSFLV